MLAYPKVERILVATDFLASSRVASDYAAAFARRFNATVMLLHAIELDYPARAAEAETSRPSVTRSAARERLEAIAAGISCSGLKVEIHLEDGIPADVIPRAADRLSADLLVLGVYGVHRGLAHLLIGSNTENILLSSRCPTMTVGAHVMAGVDPSLHFNEVLYISDLTGAAAAAAPLAVFLSREFGAQLDICQLLPEAVEKDPRLHHALAEQYCRVLKQVLPKAPPEWSAPAFHLDRCMKIDEIIRRARSQSAGLIVLGVHAESHFRLHLHSSFAYQLLARATCPVISVPGSSIIGLQPEDL